MEAFLDRPIDGDWPYLWIDATYIKVRQNGRIVSVAVIVAVGANADGRREVLGMQVGPTEAETFCSTHRIPANGDNTKTQLAVYFQIEAAGEAQPRSRNNSLAKNVG